MQSRRLEHKYEETVYINADSSTPGLLKPEGTWTKIYTHWQNPYKVELWKAEGGHGGANPVILKHLFGEKGYEKVQTEDKYNRAADFRSGAYSILCGTAANLSIKEKKLIKISELVHGIKSPDYTSMPDDNSPLPITKDAERHKGE